MAATKGKTTTDRSHAKPKVTRDHRGVVVGSEIGVTLPIGDTTAHLRFSFWHERIAKSDSADEIRRTASLVDDFNEAELDRRTKKYLRLIARIMNEDDDEEEDDEPKKKGKKQQSVQERARARRQGK